VQIFPAKDQDKDYDQIQIPTLSVTFSQKEVNGWGRN